MTEFRVDVQNIFDSPLLKDKPFPDGKRLEVIATVYESATGNEETESHDATIFTKSPFVFKFTKSRLNFMPGHSYFLKVLILPVPKYFCICTRRNLEKSFVISLKLF